MGYAQLPDTNRGTWPMPNTGPTSSTHQSDWLSYFLPCITLGTTMQGKHFPSCTFVGCEGLLIATPTLDAPYRRICLWRLCPPLTLGCSIVYLCNWSSSALANNGSATCSKSRLMRILWSLSCFLSLFTGRKPRKSRHTFSHSFCVLPI